MNEIGFKNNKLTLIEILDKRYCGHITGKFKCECGNEKIYPIYKVRYGVYKSCGCSKYKDRKINFTPKQLEKCRENARKMGLATRKYPEICSYCQKKEHYAHGFCRNCYEKNRRGTLKEK